MCLSEHGITGPNRQLTGKNVFMPRKLTCKNATLKLFFQKTLFSEHLLSNKIHFGRKQRFLLSENIFLSNNIWFIPASPWISKS